MLQRQILTSLTYMGLFMLGFSASVHAQPKVATAGCPLQFHQVPLYPQSTLCQPFADGLPATLVYHAAGKKQQLVDFYRQQMGAAGSVKQQKNRTVMQYQQGKKIIVLSADGKGTQVDILIQE